MVGVTSPRGTPTSTFNVLSLPSLAQWLDPSDTSTATLSNGRVIQRNDKSGNARHISNAEAFAPANNATGQNGLPTEDYSTTNGLTCSSFVAASAYTVIFVIQVGQDDGYFFKHFDGSVHGVRIGTATTNRRVEHTGAGGAQTNGAVGAACNVWTVRGGTGASFTPEIRIDGVVVSAFSSSAYSAPGAGTFGTGLGWVHGGASGVNKVGERIYCDARLADADVLAAEAYLKAKWGTP